MNTLSDMVRSLKRVFPNGPSWPFRTQSARTVWEAAEGVFNEHPDWMTYQVIQEAFRKSGIHSSELTPEDYSILSMAARWKTTVLRGETAFKQDRLSKATMARLGFSMGYTPAPPAPYPGANPAQGK